MSSNNPIKILIAALVVFIIFLTLGLVAILGRNNLINPSSLSIIDINHSETRKVDNDTATVTAFIKSDGPKEDIEKLNTENNRKVSEVIAFLKSQDISENDIKTNKNTNNYFPLYSIPMPENENKISVESSIEITFKNIDKDQQKPNTILSQLTSKGITGFSNFQYSVEKQKQICETLENNLFQILDTKAKQRMSVIEGKVVKTEYQTTNNSCNNNRYYPMYKDLVGSTASDNNSNAGSEIVNNKPPVLPGSQEITIEGNLKVYYNTKNSWF
jgi:uncharacterized protein YggE